MLVFNLELTDHTLPHNVVNVCEISFLSLCERDFFPRLLMRPILLYPLSGLIFFAAEMSNTVKQPEQGMSNQCSIC